MSLHIEKLAGLHFHVRDLERARRFYVDCLGFTEVGRSSPELENTEREREFVFRAGDILVTCASPSGEGGRAARYLSRHPDGVGAISFEVKDIRAAFAELDDRGGTPTSEIQSFDDGRGRIETFSITTPIGDTTFRFVERHGYRGHFPGMEAYDIPRGAENALGFTDVDHVTSNFQTMKPALLWLEHVLGFQPFWAVEFHTEGLGEYASGGSGLRSRVMWDPATRIKFANNEPRRPSFENSQINVFHEENRGDGVQHVALGVRDIVRTARGLRDRGVELMPAPPGYHEQLPERLRSLGIDGIDEDLRALAELDILVDGSGPDAYLLQVFLKDAASLHRCPEAGPFFFELIQRNGDAGFGAGNFRALFESVEGQQVARTG
jgi:4-hydroxyphenylpyruvate dioxygenase